MRVSGVIAGVITAIILAGCGRNDEPKEPLAKRLTKFATKQAVHAVEGVAEGLSLICGHSWNREITVGDVAQYSVGDC